MNSVEDLPGVRPVEGREFRYLEWDSLDSFRELFPRISEFGGPELPSHGGILNEDAVIVLPTGENFFGISFRGDLTGWDSKVSACAAANNVRIGRIADRQIMLSDGQQIPLERCHITVDW